MVLNPVQIEMAMHDRRKDPFLVLFQELSKEVVVLFHDLFLFKATRDIITMFVKPHCADLTYPHWVMTSAADSLIVAIGRLCDPNGESESLVSFLTTLKGKEERYLYKSKHLEMFDDKIHASRRFAELGGNKTMYPIELVERDINQLVKRNPCRKIIDYRNEYVAHRAKSRKGTPTYNEMYESTEIISSILKKYELLLLGRVSLNHTPSIQGDWTRSLRFPWLPGGAAIKPTT